MRGFRKKALMNLALPSGSSPPEKPPGRTIIWLSPIMRAAASMLSVMAAGLRLLMTSTRGSAPARMRARAVSTSQLVPGKAGMKATGRWLSTLGMGQRLAAKVTAASFSPSPRQGKTLSSLPS